MNNLPKKSLAYGMRYTWLLSITDDTSWKYIMETPHFGSLFVPMFPVPNSSGAWFHRTSEGNSVACFSERWPESTQCVTPESTQVLCSRFIMASTDAVYNCVCLAH